MNEKPSPKFDEVCSFIPANLHDSAEWEELRQQRLICGWQFEPVNINKWRDQMDAGEKTIFWISLPSKDNVRAGHISLDTLANSDDPKIQNSDKSIMTIKTFCILREYRAMGLGRKAMDELEKYAKIEPYGSPNCKAIVIDTISERYFTDPELIKFRDKWRPVEEFGGQCNASWYMRRGYVKWKEEYSYHEKHPKTGEMIDLLGSWLWKDLK